MEGFAMSDAILQAVQQSQLKTDLPVVSVGDTIDVHVRIIEGVKERIQVFTGVVIKRQNSGLEETITVRRIVANEGVERTFPINSPRVAKIEIVRHGHTRRSKLYYLRDRVGKKRRLRDRKSGLGWLNEQQGKADTARAESQAKEKAAAETAKAEE
jgi:large subunit ribosomal protein L19